MSPKRKRVRPKTKNRNGKTRKSLTRPTAVASRLWLVRSMHPHPVSDV
jgi:hypothetical protein